MKFRFIFLAIAVLVIFSAVGCRPPIMPSETGDYEVNLEVDKNITESLRILVHNNDGGLEKGYINALIPGFKVKFPNVTITLEERMISDEKYAESINDAIASGRVPDLFYTNTAFYYYLVSKNCIVNIEPYIAASEESGVFNMDADFYKEFFDMSSYNGKRYVVPRTADSVVTFYNKEILNAAGINTDTNSRMNNNWTWENFMSLCNDVAAYLTSPAATANGHSSAYALQPSLDWESVFNPLMLSNGAQLFDEQGNVTVDTQQMRQFAQMIRDMYSTPKLARPQTAPGTFKSGSAAFTFRSDGPAEINKYQPVRDAGFDVLPFPLIGENPHIGSGFAGWGISTTTAGAKRDLAWQFLNYMISAEGQTALINAGSSTPSIRIDIAEEKSWAKGFENKNLDAYLIHSEYKCVSDWFTKHDPKYMFDIMFATYDFIENLSGNTRTIDECILRAKANLNEAIDR